jgi:hypothetical protein
VIPHTPFGRGSLYQVGPGLHSSIPQPLYIAKEMVARSRHRHHCTPHVPADSDNHRALPRTLTFARTKCCRFTNNHSAMERYPRCSALKQLARYRVRRNGQDDRPCSLHFGPRARPWRQNATAHSRIMNAELCCASQVGHISSSLLEAYDRSVRNETTSCMWHWSQSVSATYSMLAKVAGLDCGAIRVRIWPVL